MLQHLPNPWKISEFSSGAQPSLLTLPLPLSPFDPSVAHPSSLHPGTLPSLNSTPSQLPTHPATNSSMPRSTPPPCCSDAVLRCSYAASIKISIYMGHALQLLLLSSAACMAVAATFRSIQRPTPRAAALARAAPCCWARGGASRLARKGGGNLLYYAMLYYTIVYYTILYYTRNKLRWNQTCADEHAAPTSRYPRKDPYAALCLECKVFIYIYIYMYIYVYTHTCIHIHIICIYVYIYVY